MFKIVEDFDSQYFVELTSEYYEKYSDKFIKEICPKYSYGHLNRICFCRIYYDSNSNIIHLTHFNNYVREYYIKNKIKCEDLVFRGLGVRLLKSILINFINSGMMGDTQIMLDMVNTKNKKLVDFYKNLSFCLIDDDNFFSNIDSVLQKLENVKKI